MYAIFTVLLAFTLNQVFAASPDDLLAQLRSDLHSVRASKSTEPVASKVQPDVKTLVGLRQTQIHVVLGDPDACVKPKNGSCLGSSEWTYSFYRLPPGWRGGGPELVLSFDEDLGVRLAAWLYSR